MKKLTLAALMVLIGNSFAIGGELHPLLVSASGGGGCGPCNGDGYGYGDPCNGDGYGDPCADGCGRHGCWGRRNCEAGFNCGCNGSYKFPVPPLYTYHWPGMYSAQLMTEYHSPFRFPPLKPYVDEVPPQQVAAKRNPNSVLRQASLTAAAPASAPTAEPASFSHHLQNLGR